MFDRVLNTLLLILKILLPAGLLTDSLSVWGRGICGCGIAKDWADIASGVTMDVSASKIKFCPKVSIMNLDLSGAFHNVLIA